MKIVVFIADSNGGYPVPATKGGAVSTLVETLVADNEKQKLCELTVVSLYEENAAKIAEEKYKNTHFVWVRVPKFIKFLDNLLFSLIRTLFKNKKAISFKSILTLFWYIKFSSNYLKSNNFDKVVLENNVPIASIIRSSKYKGEYYYHFHNIPRINANCKKVFDRCNGYLCVSRYVAEEIEKSSNAIGPIPRNKVNILYNCIDTELFKPLNENEKLEYRKEIFKRYNIPNSNRLIIFAGRLSKEKGIDKLLCAIKNIDDVTLLIVGGLLSGLDLNDSYQKKIHSMAEELGKKVVFTGYVDHKKIPIFYNISDIAVLPSMWDEPAGLTMIESMACGVPVVTTNSGGIPEYVGDVAYIINRDENLVENISRNINMFFNLNESEKKLIRDEEMRRIRDNFTKEKYLGKFIESLK